MVATVAGLSFALLCMTVAYLAILKRNRAILIECAVWRCIARDLERSSQAWANEAKKWQSVADEFSAKSSN